MFAKLDASKKILSAFAAVGLIAALSSLVLFWFLLDIARDGENVGARLSPLVDAAMEIKFSGTGAQLVIEEIMAGDRSETVDTMYQHLADARFYARAILDGDANDEDSVIRAESPEVRRSVELLLAEVDALQQVAEQRHGLLDLDNSAGSGADQEFDLLYESIIEGMAAASEIQGSALFQRLIGEARFRLAHGHLILEEILSGGDDEEIEETEAAFAAAEEAFAKAARLWEPAIGADEIIADIQRLGELTQDRYAAFLELGTATETAKNEFDSAYAQFIESADAAEAAVQDAMQAGLRNLSDTRRMALIATGVFAILLIGVIVLSNQWLDRVLGQRLRVLGRTMQSLIDGDLEVTLPDWKTTDEVGLLRGSVDELRNAFIRQRDLERNVAAESKAAQQGRREAEAAMARAEEERKKAEAEKRSAEDRAQKAREFVRTFQGVVDSACAGKFDARIPATSGEADLDALALSLNQLMQFVDHGIAETTRVLSLVARGNLAERMEGEFEGAFATLRDDLNTSVGELNRIVSGLSGKSQDIATDVGRVQRSSDELAHRSTSQAASLEQTSAAVTEIAATVKSNEADSQLVADRARDAREKAHRGGDVVTEAIRAVRQIDENARKVSDIIKVINDISFQTNLLALNAGVEAARAGEAGKGFAVVAQEVRALAQRASDAAEDIGDLIDSSGRDVNEGVRLVTSTGAVLEEIATSIKDVTEITERIALSSREQSSGISEISSVISDLDRITQQNATMADESVNLARSLNSHAQEMEVLMDFFSTRAAVSPSGASTWDSGLAEHVA